VRVSLPYYASPDDLEFMLSAIEFVADHGELFVPAYRLGWLDGVWRHIERPMTDVQPIELTVEALEEAAQSFSAGDHEAPMSESQLKRDRAHYLEHARRLAEQKRAELSKAEPKWNPPTGQSDVDSLVWFKYVHCDAPWS
jgi:hypothetical protein